MSFFKNETTLPVLVTVMCVLIATVTILYGFNTGKFSWLENRNKKQVAVQKEEEKIVRTDYTDVARKTLDWIDKQRNEEGWYILERGCDYEKKTCDIVWDNKEGNKDGLIATWARLNFYEQHKDPKDLEIVKKDIDLFYEKYKDDNLKDSLWICKITYEMAQSKYIDQIQKDKLKELCLNVKYPIPDEVKKYIDGINEGLGKFSGEIWNYWEGYSMGIRGFNSYFSLMTEMIARNKWQKVNNNMGLVKEYWQINKDYLNEASVEDKCLIGLSGLDLYRFGGEDKEVLGFVEGIYSKYIMNGSVEVKKIYRTSICGLMLKDLYRVTRKYEYLVRFEEISKTIIKFNTDTNNQNEIYLDGGFYKSIAGGFLFLNKNVAENGLLVNLLFD